MTSVKYGDTVFLTFPSISPPKIWTNVITTTNPTSSRPVATDGTITDADPYIIDVTPGKNIGDIVNANDAIRLRRLVDPERKVLTDAETYDNAGRKMGVLTLTNSNTNNTYWDVKSATGATGPITYGQQIRLLNQNTKRDALYIVLSLPAIISYPSDSTSNSIMAFAPGPLENAKLQCCRDDPSLVQLGFCGEFQGTSCTGFCDTILTDYCAQVTTTDPKCGCLLPASFYAVSGLVGPPECIDDRCVNQNTYRKSTQCKPSCNIINCVINANDIAGTNIDKIIFDQKCGNTPGPSPGPSPGPGPSPSPGPSPGPGPSPNGTSTSNYRIYIYIGIAIIVIIIAALILYLIINSGKNKSTNYW
nr:hypothetical protein [Megavirus caiporensis]